MWTNIKILVVGFLLLMVLNALLGCGKTFEAEHLSIIELQSELEQKDAQIKKLDAAMVLLSMALQECKQKSCKQRNYWGNCED